MVSQIKHFIGGKLVAGGGRIEVGLATAAEVNAAFAAARAAA